MSLLPVADARRLIVTALAPVESETISLAHALGRVLVRDASAHLSHPPADSSAMDGYAVRFADLSSTPHMLRVVGESGAGHPWRGTLGPGEAVRIFTGAHVPAGADTIVIQENTEARDGSVVIKEMPQPKRHIRPLGQDFRVGDLGIRAPRRLTACDIGLLAAMNNPQIEVGRKPRVGVLSTGDEIVMPGETVGEGQIVSANGPGLCAFIESCGGQAIHLGIVGDELGALRTAISRAETLDLLVTSGGASVGDHDLVRQALHAEDFALGFHKIAMRPGKPLLFGTVGKQKRLPVLGLPGNPVSAMVCAVLFLGPALARLQGLAGDAPATWPARAGAALKENDSREEYLRASLTSDPAQGLIATALPTQDSGMLSSLAQADALIVRPPRAPAAAAGAMVPVIPLRLTPREN